MVLLLLLAGCGPLITAVGIGNLLEDDPIDPLRPDVETLQVLVDGEVVDEPAFLNQAAPEFLVEANKPVKFSGTLTGPGGFNPAMRVREIGDNRGGLTPETDLLDGDYTLNVMLRDSSGREDTEVHEFTIDKVAPQSPIVFDVVAATPRTIRVRWIPSDDRESEDNPGASVPSDVVHYNVYFDIGPDRVVSQSEIESSGGVSVGIPLSYRSPIESPLEVSGAESSSFEIPNLAAGRFYRIQVTAVDAAGNESVANELSSGNSVAPFVVRTRSGGDGTFIRKPLFELSPTTVFDIVEIEVADLDGDGIDDLVILATEAIFVYHGTGAERIGDGGFVLSQELDAPGADLTAVELLDRSLDGTLDIIAGDAGGILHVFVGTGTNQPAPGPFADPVTITLPTTQPVRDLAGGDLEPDGFPDLVIVTDGNGARLARFRSPSSVDFDSLSFAVAEHVVLADHDADSDLDVTYGLGAELRSVRGSRPDTQAVFQSSTSAGGSVNSLVVGDLDGDAFPDLVAGHTDGKIGVIFGAPPFKDDTNLPGVPGSQTGLIQFEPPDVFPSGFSPAVSVIADFDSDRINDIAVATFAGGLLLHFGNEGEDGAPDRSFSTAAPIAALVTASAIATGDFNSDGIPDLVIGNGLGQVQISLGAGSNRRGDGTFAVPQAIGAKGNENLFVGDACDLDGDGIDDFFGWTGSSLRVFDGSGTNGQGDGVFVFSRTNFSHMSWDWLVSGDFDADGDPDFAGVNDSTNGYVEMQLARGNNFQRTFGFNTAASPATGIATPPPTATDLDNDGVLDLLFTHQGRVTALMGATAELPGPNAGTNPSVSPKITTVTHADLRMDGIDLYATAVHDLDGNGQTDIVGLDLAAGKLRASLQTSVLTDLAVGPVASPGFEDLADGETVSSGFEDPFASTLPFKLKLTPAADETVGSGARIEILIFYLASSGGPDFVQAVQELDALQNVRRARSTIDLSLLFNNLVSTGRGIDVRAGATEITDGFEFPSIGVPFVVFVSNLTGTTLSAEPDAHSFRRDRFQFVPEPDVAISGFDDATGLAADAHHRLLIVADLDLDRDGDVVALHPEKRLMAVVKFVVGGDTTIFDFDTVKFTGDVGDVSLAGNPIAIRAADIDGDGVPDIVGITDEGEVFTFLAGLDGDQKPTGAFTPGAVHALNQKTAHTFAIGDFNSDRVPDVLVGSVGEPVLLLGNGAATANEVIELQEEGQERQPPE